MENYLLQSQINFSTEFNELSEILKKKAWEEIKLKDAVQQLSFSTNKHNTKMLMNPASKLKSITRFLFDIWQT